MDAVTRDYNHPSIIIWVPINESWGVPNVSDPPAAGPPESHVHADALAGSPPARSSTTMAGSIPIPPIFSPSTTIRMTANSSTSVSSRLQEGRIPRPVPGQTVSWRLGSATTAPRFPFRIRRSLVCCHAEQMPPEQLLGLRRHWSSRRMPALDRIRSLYEAIAKLPKIIGDLLHPAHRCRTGGQRPDDLRPQAQIRPREIRAINALLR